MSAPLSCPYCGAGARLMVNRYVARLGDEVHERKLWVCGNYPKCDAYVGVHPNTETPVGTLANAALRCARMSAHASFDTLWIRKMKRENLGKRDARTRGYAWLAKRLRLKPAECHIGRFDLETCERVIAACAPYVVDRSEIRGGPRAGGAAPTFADVYSEP